MILTKTLNITYKQKCDTFIWGGCQGVVPFKTKAECEKARCPYVRCGDPEPVKICRASLPRWKYDAKRDVSLLSVLSFVFNMNLFMLLTNTSLFVILNRIVYHLLTVDVVRSHHLKLEKNAWHLFVSETDANSLLNKAFVRVIFQSISSTTRQRYVLFLAQLRS